MLTTFTEPGQGRGGGEDMEHGEATKREMGRMARAVGVLSTATMVSRVLGLLRDMVTASLFGAGWTLDAFFVAFRIPNMLRSLLAEGSLTVSFVPVYVETLEREGEARANRLGNIIFTLLGVVVAAATLAGVLFAPWLVRVMAAGFAEDPQKFELTITLTRLVFPYIMFIALTALAAGILNSRGHFLYPALAPVVLNIFIIAAAYALTPLLSIPVASLAVGVLAGGFCHFLMQVSPLRRTGFRYRPDFHWRDQAVRKILLLMGPSAFGVAVYQFNILISTFLASWLPTGSVSYLYYAERMFQLPLGVFAVSVGMASLPSLSRLAAQDDWAAFTQTMGAATRFLWFIVLPASVGLFLIAEPVIALLFRHGRFDAEMARLTADALRWYSLALIPVASTRVVVQGFYALKDTRTPVKGAIWSLAVNLAASLALMGPLKHGGLALATAVSSTFNLLYMSWQFRRKTGHNPYEKLRGPLSRMAAASALMAAAVWGLAALAGEAATAEGGRGGLALYVAVAVSGGVGVYFAAARLLGITDLDRLLDRFRRRA